MIFVGGGSLLSQGVFYALEIGLDVKAVCCPVGDPSVPRLRRMNVPVLESDDPSTDLMAVMSGSEGETVFSINNKHILDDRLLSCQAEFFNIHNGLVQKYRGVAEVCVFAAICSGESSYGVTLHKLMPGQKVDAGPVVAQRKFRVAESDGFASIMMNSLQKCQQIYEEFLIAIAHSKYEASVPELLGSAYSYKDVPRIIEATEPERLARASNLGVYRPFFPRLAQLLSSAKQPSPRT